jgi:peptidoglycan/LPS O-acetylase OafA/YrhL
MKMKFEFIDSIRGVAILMVILVHVALSVKTESPVVRNLAAYGQMGVQLFFVASAYTLTHSWLKRLDEPNRLRNFAIRRFFRIAPVYYLGIALYCGVSVFENYYMNGTLAPEESYSGINILVNLLFLNGFYPPANNTIVPGGWSIGTEMAFYVVFPLLMQLVYLRGKKGRFWYWLSPCIGLFVAHLLLAGIYLLTGGWVQNNNFYYFSIVNQLPVFLLGISFYFLQVQAAWPVRSARANLMLFLLFSALSGWAWQSPLLFSLIPFVAGISFLFLIKFFELAPAANGRWLQEVGKASYSIYLFHFLFALKAVPLISHLFPVEERLGGDVALCIYYVLTVVFSFGMAKISERFIERRFIYIGRQIIGNNDGNEYVFTPTAG